MDQMIVALRMQIKKIVTCLSVFFYRDETAMGNFCRDSF